MANIYGAVPAAGENFSHPQGDVELQQDYRKQRTHRQFIDFATHKKQAWQNRNEHSQNPKTTK